MMETEEDKRVIGTANDEIALSTSEELSALSLALAEQAKRSLYILTWDLEAAIYDNPAFTDAVSRLARKSRYAKVHMLVQRPERAVKRGHRLLNLGQRLSTNFRLRVPCEEDRHIVEAWLIADEVAYIQRPLADRYEGKTSFNDPQTARALAQRFLGLWNRSETDPELRRLLV